MGDRTRRFQHDAVRLEHGIDVAGRSSGVVGQCHRGATEDVDVGDDTLLDQSIAESAEGILDRSTIEQRP
jgi:hypothetical protein